MLAPSDPCEVQGSRRCRASDPRLPPRLRLKPPLSGVAVQDEESLGEAIDLSSRRKRRRPHAAASDSEGSADDPGQERTADAGFNQRVCATDFGERGTCHKAEASTGGGRGAAVSGGRQARRRTAGTASLLSPAGFLAVLQACPSLIGEPNIVTASLPSETMDVFVPLLRRPHPWSIQACPDIPVLIRRLQMPCCLPTPCAQSAWLRGTSPAWPSRWGRVRRSRPTGGDCWPSSMRLPSPPSLQTLPPNKVCGC